MSLRLESGDTVVSIITTGSAERLGLASGSRLQVVVKASHVLLLDSSDPELATSARNRLGGRVREVEHGFEGPAPRPAR